MHRKQQEENSNSDVKPLVLNKMLHGGNVLNTFWTTELSNEMLRHGLKRRGIL